MTLSVLKDLYFTRAFGKQGAVVGPVPPASYLLYTTRDSMTIFASFNLPPMVSSVLSSQFGISKLYADVSAQLISPCAIQALSTPLHLLGMDLYNQPVSTTATRVSFIQREYLATTAARMGRIFPAFGIGGVANKLFKKHSREFLAR